MHKDMPNHIKQNIKCSLNQSDIIENDHLPNSSNLFDLPEDLESTLYSVNLKISIIFSSAAPKMKSWIAGYAMLQGRTHHSKTGGYKNKISSSSGRVVW